jgi:glycosyltransferase-like protein
MTSIGIFTYSVKPRGSVVHAACLAEALQDEGADVTLYALAKGRDDFFRPLRCPLVLFPAAPAPADPDRLIEQRIDELHAGFERIADRHDVYHAEDCLTASALLTANTRDFRPVVRTVHHVERYESPFLAACQRRSIERADLLLSVSARTARDVAADFGRSSRIVHNGVDLRRFTAPAAAPELAARLGISAEHLVVLSVGGVEERKNTLCMLEAAIVALRENSRLFWVVAGGASIWDHSELERRFDARVAELPATLGRRIARTGPLEEAALGWLYQRSDVLLCASLHEGFGLCVLEALAAGSAVIASAREPFTEFLDPSVAVLVDPAASAAIADALVELAADSTHRARLGAAGRERAQTFSWEKAARAHLEAYRSLAQEPASALTTASAFSALEGP